MATMNISINDNLKDFVQERVAQTGFSNTSDYVRTLIRQDQEKYLQQRLEQLLLAGIESGEPEKVDTEFWQALHERADA